MLFPRLNSPQIACDIISAFAPNSYLPKAGNILNIKGMESGFFCAKADNMLRIKPLA